MIPGILGAVGTLVNNWYQGRLEKQKAQHELDLAEINNKARLMADLQSNNQAWEMANLQDRDKWLRRLSFMMFAAPLVIAIFAPEQVRQYFTVALSAIPDWWLKTFVAINGVVWGIANLKNTVPAVLDIFKKK